MNVSVNWTGVSTFLAQLAEAPVKVALAGDAALYQAALKIFAESQREVPVEFGTLRASGLVSEPEHRGLETVVQISYGGAASEYAYFVHERLDLTHAPPTKAKYLEDPATRGQAEFFASYGEAISVAMQG